YRGHPNPREFRGTIVAVPAGGGWRLAALRLSPLGWRPPGCPPAAHRLRPAQTADKCPSRPIPERQPPARPAHATASEPKGVAGRVRGSRQAPEISSGEASAGGIVPAGRIGLSAASGIATAAVAAVVITILILSSIAPEGSSRVRPAEPH